MYMPPSSGNSSERRAITSAEGRKKNSAARTHRASDPDPACAAAASQRMPAKAEMLNRIRSQSRNSRRREGRASAMLGVPAAEGRWYPSAFVQLLVSDPRVVVDARRQAFRYAEECTAG